MPKISIITPIFCDIPQKIDWLDETIQSVLKQSITDWEMILIDDKSPLSLGPVKLKYQDDTRLRWLENATNEGPAKTRNTAVALAESDCILPLDSDDMLAEPETLEDMYDTWIMDTTKTIYGNLQMYKRVTPNDFQQVKLVQLGSYTFEMAMNLGGTIPVTVMHSKDCHYAAGGWKTEFELGLEDVEYWIAAGKRGFCGQKINYTTLIYRQQETSRAYKLKHINKQYRIMQDLIKSMHDNIYKGVYPMGCCGKESSTTNPPIVDPVVMSQQAEAATKITILDGYDEKDLEWVAYQGGKRGRFDIFIRGPQELPTRYTIYGKGHIFQIHKRHHKQFADRQKLEYRINQPDPRQQPEPEPKPEPAIQAPSPQVTEAPPPPQLSTLVRLDRVGIETREIDIKGPVVEPPPPTDSYHILDLGLSDNLTSVLTDANWTVERISKATPQMLATLPGIGIIRANAIIEKARNLNLE